MESFDNRFTSQVDFKINKTVITSSTACTHSHVFVFSWLGTTTSIKSGGVKLVLNV
jgi:hypothetical protein